ncbi:FAD-binding protein, partial [Sutterella massiliensis]
MAVVHAPAASAEEKTCFDLSTDVVVVGLGAAGAATAITAADKGAQVLLIERQPLKTLRSNTRMSGGYIHCPEK